MPIYTKTGDLGTTSLFGGKRVIKSDPQIEAYGSVDELTSFLGMIAVKLTTQKDKEFILAIQSDLYVLMGFLAGAKQDLIPLKERVKEFENRIDKLEKQLPKLTRFILPGGTELSSWFHIVRTVCRRAERRTTDFLYIMKRKKEEESLIIIQYLNRLSDLFFTVARFYNNSQELIT